MDTISIDCECGKEIDLSLKQMKPGSSIHCPACGIKISFEGDDIEKEVDKIESEIFKIFGKLEKL